MQTTHENESPILSINGPVATITLSRPKVANKLIPADLQTIRDHINQINADEKVLVLIMRSQGKYFCSGYDVAEVIASSQVQGSSFGEMVDAIESCKAVTIAALQGGVYGGATDLALACDFRLGAMATEMFMPAAQLGLHFYQTGLERYVTRLGVDTAKRLFLTAEKLDAKQMYDCGFLTSLIQDGGELNKAVDALVVNLLNKAPIALLGMKKHLNQIARNQVDGAALAAEVQRSVISQDIQEGSLAWKEKRQPKFSGK